MRILIGQRNRLINHKKVILQYVSGMYVKKHLTLNYTEMDGLESKGTIYVH